MRVVGGAEVLTFIKQRGGAVYVWPHAYGCCRGRTIELEASTDPPDRDFRLLHAADGFRIFAARGLKAPDELHLELSRRAQLRAYWNGQAWVG